MSKDLKNALNEMMQPLDANVVPSPKPRGAAPQSKSAAPLPGGGGGTGGAVSSLVEVSYAGRTHYAERTITTVDGLVSFKVKPIRVVSLTDQANNVVTFEFKEPT
jgi:hypothetical protein